MFGTLSHPKKPKLRSRPVPKIIDVQGPQPDLVGHVARDPGTDYSVRFKQYIQRKTQIEEDSKEELRRNMAQEQYNANFLKHTVKGVFHTEVSMRVGERMRKYDANIEKRRKRLLEILWREEREYNKEVIVNAQKGVARITEQKILKIKAKKAQEEEERHKFVKEKKLQQLLNDCQEIRPIISRMKMLEAREGQRSQMKENAMKLESDRELENFWHKLMLKDVELKEEREKAELLSVRKKRLESLSALTEQMKEKKIQIQELEQEKQEDLKTLNQIKAEMLIEQQQKNDEKRRKCEELTTIVATDITKRKEVLKRREQDEKDLVKTYETISLQEVHREKAQAKTSTEDARKEMVLFMEHRKQLILDRKEEEKIMEKLVEQSRKKAEERQLQARCRDEFARQALQEATVRGLAEQMEYKKKMSEEQLRKDQAEQEVLKLNIELQERLRIESETKKILATKKYAEQLKKQIEYKSFVRDREKKELERLLQQGVKEDEEFKELNKTLSGCIKSGSIHPFRRYLELDEGNCICP